MAEPRKQLLTVDDSEIDREIMAQTLAAAFPGADVHRVSNPSTVERVCGDHHFDCVLLDYNMPEMDGLTLARRLRAADAFLPIILATSVGDEMLVAEALRSGVSDYIVKSRVAPEALRRIVDRTMHAAAQARLIEDQRVELENFSYALAHDFKQPIRQIITFSEMISEDFRGDETAVTKKHLAFLCHAATRLDKLVDVMVQYTLLNQPPELADIDLNKVFASVRASLAPLLAERGGEFVASSRAPMVRGNETLLIQVVQNLVVNGLHYNRSAVPRVVVSVRSDAESCVIEVKDNGIGIANEYLTEIFKPLIRLHTAKDFLGSGLGLTLARKAIHTQKGEIWCESTPDHGSVFHVRLPATEAQNGRQIKRRHSPARRKSGSAARVANNKVSLREPVAAAQFDERTRS